MGQRHQTLIRYINKERNSDNDTRVCTLYNQWCYGRMPILSLFKIAKFNKINTTDSERNYNSLTDDRNCYIDKIDTIIKLISADFNTGFLTNYFIFDKVSIKKALDSGEVVPGVHLEEKQNLQIK